MFNLDARWCKTLAHTPFGHPSPSAKSSAGEGIPELWVMMSFEKGGRRARRGDFSRSLFLQK